MRLANSPYYGSPRRVSSTRHATVMLGFDTVRGAGGRARRAACSTAGPSSGPTDSGGTRSRPRAAASVIARKVGLSTEDAFSAGSVARPRRGAAAPARRARRSRRDRTRPTVSDQVAAELAAFGVTHADEGAAALDAWGFPEPFVEAIALHQHGDRRTEARARVACCAWRRPSRSSTRRCPATRRRPTSTGCSLAIGLRPDDYDVVDARSRRPARADRRPPRGRP